MIRDDLLPDEGYHRSVVSGDRTPVLDKIGKDRLNALMYGRHKGDGRAADQYVLPEPVEWKPSA